MLETRNRINFFIKAFDLILILAGLGMLFSLPHVIEGDGRVRYHALAEMLSAGKMPDIKYSMIGALFSTPFYFLGNFFESPKWWCARYNLILFGLGLACIFLLLVRQTDNALLRKFILVLIFGSMFPYHQMNYYGEVFTALLVGVGILAFEQGHEILGWASIILGVANTPATVVGLGFVVLALVWIRKQWRFFLPLVLAVAIILLEAWIRGGGIIHYGGDGGNSTFMPYSGLSGFSYPLLFGLLSILFSFGKGIFWFSPGLLLRVQKGLAGISEKLHETYKLWIFFLVGLVLVYAKWWSWYGGWFWGPRFFLFASIPASFAIAANLQTKDRSIKFNLFILVVLLWSFWIGINGPIFEQHNLSLCEANGYELESLCWYVPEFGVLFRPFVIANEHLSVKTILYIILSSMVFLRLALPVTIQLWRDFKIQMKNITQGFQLKF